MIHRYYQRDKAKHIGSKYSFSLIKEIKFTEKSHALSEMRKYVFIVDNNANKINIAQSVQEIFDVKVKSVNTMNYRSFKGYFRGRIGHTKRYKKAIVTLEAGTINIGNMQEENVS